MGQKDSRPIKLQISRKPTKNTLCYTFLFIYYAPNFREAERAYWFEPVRLSVRL